MALRQRVNRLETRSGGPDVVESAVVRFIGHDQNSPEGRSAVGAMMLRRGKKLSLDRGANENADAFEARISSAMDHFDATGAWPEPDSDEQRKHNPQYEEQVK